jgi:uncharacterized membrane protein YfcA
MTPAGWPILLAGVFGVAALYASVGHGGASGYLAVLSLFGFRPESMVVSALCLNLFVSALSFYSFRRAGHFDWKLFWPFAAGSIPLAYVGGLMKISSKAYAALLGFALLFAAIRLILPPSPNAPADKAPRLPAALAAGAGLGLLSGMVGVGGGIFLSPLMLLLRWADAKRVAAVSALFIFVNSVSGLAGQLQKGAAPALSLWPLALAAFAGGVLGSHIGAKKFDQSTLRRTLGFVLLIAAVKLAKGVFA